MNLHNMAPNARRSLVITSVIGALAVAIYLFAIGPAESSLRKAQEQRDAVEQRHQIMTDNLRNAEKTQSRLDNCETNLAPFRAAMLKPMLESYAMGAKAQLENIALAAGLTEIEYEDLSPIALPLPKRLPAQLHARLPVRITASGSYQAAISFLLRVEREFPLITLQALTISAGNDPRRQRAEFLFEWPTRGLSTVVKKGAAK